MPVSLFIVLFGPTRLTSNPVVFRSTGCLCILDYNPARIIVDKPDVRDKLDVRGVIDYMTSTTAGNHRVFFTLVP